MCDYDGDDGLFRPVACVTFMHTPAPTTPPPTPAPTPDCVEDADCPRDPLNKCAVPVCNTDAGVCQYTDFASACDDGNPCTVDSCRPDTGLCRHVRDYTCCVLGDDVGDWCYVSGYLCEETICNATAAGNGTTTTGTCQEVPIDGCCEDHPDCFNADDLCEEPYCNIATNTCENAPVQCSGSFDNDTLCTRPACNPLTGDCQEMAVPGQDKCPGACCFRSNDSASACVDGLALLECTTVGGFWTDSGVLCSDAGVCATPAPPTPAPTAALLCCTLGGIPLPPSPLCEQNGDILVTNDTCNGACCADNACFIADGEQRCIGENAVWHGPGSSCYGIACPATTTTAPPASTTPSSTGACCTHWIVSGCLLENESNCLTTFEGTYQGSGTTCGQVSCPVPTTTLSTTSDVHTASPSPQQFACCTFGECLVKPEESCLEGSGTVTSETFCDTNTCATAAPSVQTGVTTVLDGNLEPMYTDYELLLCHDLLHCHTDGHACVPSTPAACFDANCCQ